MRIQTVQSHGKSLNIEGESAEFTGTEQYPELTTSARITTNKLPRAGLQPPALVSEKRFLHNPSKCCAPRGLCSSFIRLFRAPTWRGRRPGHSPPGRTTRPHNPASQAAPAALPAQTLHQPGVQEAAEKKQLLTRGLSDGGRFRNPMERTTGRRETLRTQNKLHRLQKAFVLGLRTWPFSQRWCNTKEQGLCQRKLFTGYADGKAAKGCRIKTRQSPPGPASPPQAFLGALRSLHFTLQPRSEHDPGLRRNEGLYNGEKEKEGKKKKRCFKVLQKSQLVLWSVGREEMRKRLSSKPPVSHTGILPSPRLASARLSSPNT